MSDEIEKLVEDIIRKNPVYTSIKTATWIAEWHLAETTTLRERLESETLAAMNREQALVKQLSDLPSKIQIDAVTETMLQAQELLNALGRERDEAQAACAVKDDILRSIIEEVGDHVCRFDNGNETSADMCQRALSTNPGQPLLDELERYKKALEWYANPHRPHQYLSGLIDFSSIAQEALNPKKESGEVI